MDSTTVQQVNNYNFSTFENERGGGSERERERESINGGFLPNKVEVQVNLIYQK